MENIRKYFSLGLAFAIISFTSIQISAMEPFERLSPQEQALERKRQGGRPKKERARRKQQRSVPEEKLYTREEFEEARQRQQQAQQEQMRQAHAKQQQEQVRLKYLELQPVLQPLELRLKWLEDRVQNLTQRTYQLERAPKVAIQEQPVCCIEADGCTEDQGVGPIPCKNKHTDLICNACLAKIKNTTNRCPICQEPLIG